MKTQLKNQRENNWVGESKGAKINKTLAKQPNKSSSRKEKNTCPHIQRNGHYKSYLKFPKMTSLFCYISHATIMGTTIDEKN